MSGSAPEVIALSSASGRELPFISRSFQQFERPLPGKADIKPEAPEIE